MQNPNPNPMLVRIRPWDNRGNCHMDEKRIQCLSVKPEPSVRSLYITEFQAIVSIGIVYVVAPPTWDDPTHLALSGLVDSSNPVSREGTDLASVAREV